MDLIYRNKVPVSERVSVKASSDAWDILNPFFEDFMDHHERMYAIFMNRSNQVLAVKHISTGGTIGTIADPKIIFQTALKLNAMGIILAHNHPSGGFVPSDPDIRLTRQIRDAGKLLEIELLDHLIISQAGYYSFADEGMI